MASARRKSQEKILSVPLVITGVVPMWPASQWTINSLANSLPNKSLKCRVMPRNRKVSNSPAWESEGNFTSCLLQQFQDWCDGKPKEDNPLFPYSPDAFSVYIDYKYMNDIFSDLPHFLEDVRWSDFGLLDVDGRDSTIWIGSAGASTPCHYDTYGFNLVAQIQGKKLWVLFPPECNPQLYPTRIPYEESSVFSEVEIMAPNLQRFPLFTGVTPIVITLHPGQILYVPRHWWHYVMCCDTSISINTWVDEPEDSESRLSEAITRVVVSSLITSLRTTVTDEIEKNWVNPTENLEECVNNIFHLKSALAEFQCQGRQICQASTLPEKVLPGSECTYEPTQSSGCGEQLLNCHQTLLQSNALLLADVDRQCDRLQQFSLVINELPFIQAKSPFSVSDKYCVNAEDSTNQSMTHRPGTKVMDIELHKNIAPCSLTTKHSMVSMHQNDAPHKMLKVHESDLSDDGNNTEFSTTATNHIHNALSLCTDIEDEQSTVENHRNMELHLDQSMTYPNVQCSNDLEKVVYMIHCCSFEHFLHYMANNNIHREQISHDTSPLIEFNSTHSCESTCLHEALLKSVLHPDVVSMVAEKLLSYNLN